MNVLIVLLLVVAGLLVAGGVGWMYPPAGLVVAGFGLGGLALFVDDGKPQ